MAEMVEQLEFAELPLKVEEHPDKGQRPKNPKAMLLGLNPVAFAPANVTNMCCPYWDLATRHGTPTARSSTFWTQ